MKSNTLQNFITSIKNSWNGLNSDTVISSRELLENLAKTSSTEPWLAELHNKKQDSVELYRDPDFGFILLAHVETLGTYRKPHNHGSGWVFYAIQHGVMEMSTFSQITDKTGKTFLVSRGANKLKSGECNVYLPGDIHETKCLSEYVLMFRLTSSDFKEEKRSGRMIQYTN